MTARMWPARALAIVPLCALVAAATVSAHHAFTPIFDMNQRMTLVGTLTRLDWRNPHIHFVVETKSRGEGESTVWTIEAMPPSYFQARRITKRDFESAIGQQVTVDVMRAKDGSPLGLMQKIMFPDGRVVAWQGS